MTLEEKMKKLMGEFLDLSGVKDTRKWHENLDHLEAIRQELNTLMGQFVEAWHDKHNPHIEYVDTSGEIGASEMEMFKTEIEKVTEMEKEKYRGWDSAQVYNDLDIEDFELEERKATTLDYGLTQTEKEMNND